jgi:hypothetical protein
VLAWGYSTPCNTSPEFAVLESNDGLRESKSSKAFNHHETMTWSRRQFINTFFALSAGSAGRSALIFAQQAETQDGFVKARGKHLVSPAGDKLTLRGINLVTWFEPEGYMFLFEGGPQSPREIEAFFNELIGPSAAAEFWEEYRRQYITESDIQLIQRSGLNSVRIPLHYKFFLPDAEGFEVLDPALDWCRRAGVWVILDMHCVPGGQTGANIDDSWGYPWLYESVKDQELICDVWRRIAQRYRDNPIVIGYAFQRADSAFSPIAEV